MHIRFFLIILLSCFLTGVHTTANAQHVALAQPYDGLFEKGLVLRQNEQWSAARSVFEKYLTVHPANSLQAINAQYYITESAIRLYNDDAEALAENFIRQHPNHPKALLVYYELGKLYASDKQYGKAARYLEKVNLSALSPQERNEVAFTLAYAQLSDRKFDEALQGFNKLKRTNGAYAPASSYYAGYIYYQNEQFEQALFDLQNAAKTPEYASQVQEMIASIYYRLGEYDKLIAYLNEEGAGASKEMQLLAADAYYKQGNYGKAAPILTSYAEATRSVKDDVLYRAGYAYYQTKDYNQAIDYLKRVADRNDSLGQYASYYLGNSYLETNNKAFALNAFKRAAESPEGNDRIREESAFKRSKVLLDEQNFQLASTELKQFLEQYPNSSKRKEATELLSQALLNSQDYNEAIAYMEQLQPKTPAIRKAYQEVTFLKGSENFNASRFYQAVQLFDKSLQYPEDPELAAKAYFWKGEAYSIGKRWNDAVNSYAGVFRTVSPNNPIHLRSRYGIGYAYYNLKQYDRALVHFREYVEKGGKNAPRYSDALLRLGDAYYANKLYGNAYEAYQTAIQENNPEADYAWFQLGLVASLNDQNNRAQEAWETLLKRFPKSAYRDDAQFNQAQLLLETGAYAKAKNDFQRFIKENPQSPFIPFALRSLALAHFNQKEYQQAEARYAQLLQEYPTHSTGNSALLGLQEVLNVQGKSEQFDTYLARYKAANPDDRSLEKVEFEAAKTLYFAQNYQRSIQAFQTYLQNYPKSVNATEATFYLAEAYTRTEQLAKAKGLYRELLMNAKGNLLQRSVQRLADLSLEENNADEALNYYHQLQSMASNKRQQTDAWQGLMLAHFNKLQYDSVRFYANRIQEQGITTGGVLNRARLYKAKAAYGKGDFGTAEQEFMQVAETAQDEQGAEALYMVGYIQHLNKEYRKSVETLFSFNQRFGSFRNWLGKAFLLIAENYKAMGEIFQAKETLRSIIENAQDASLVNEAKKRLAALEQEEESQSSAAEETDSLQNQPK